MTETPSGLMPPSDFSVEDLLEDGQMVGGVFSSGYDECNILTNDFWIQEANGLPKHSFLIAKPLMEGSHLVEDDEVETRHRLPTERTDGELETFDEDASHALLLRVRGPADLPNEGQQTSTRHDAIRQALTTQSDGVPTESDFVDPLTRRELQYSGVEASVIGTFYYEENADGEEELTFGSDIQTFFSAGHYVVYKPSAESLSWVGSYPATDDSDPIRLGKVKYTTTRVFDQGGDSPVYVDIEDFIGAKTAVFGMTRKGKSNTMKILAAAIASSDKDVGQLVFDPSGEYAYTNDQDEYALGELRDDGESISTVYKLDPAEDEEGVQPIRSNLLNRDNLEIIQNYVRMCLIDESSDYVDSFTSTHIPTKEEIQEESEPEKTRKKRVHSAFFAVISKALGEERLPEGFESTWIDINDEVFNVVNEAADLDHSKRNGALPLGSWNGDNQIVDFWEAVLKQKEEPIVEDWLHDDLLNVINMLSTSGQSGYTKLDDLKKFHNPNSEKDVAGATYEELTNGGLVVIDISNGEETVIRKETRRIVNKIRGISREKFKDPDIDDDDLPEIQLFLEEAHKQFDSETFRDQGSMNPYVELAKEGAKFKVGMVYATQEVSTVDERVRANTANWLVTHLNSGKEISELADYYRFEDFEESIRDVEEKGFVRMKTKTGQYIVPLKVDLFDEDWVADNTRFDVQKRDTDLEEGSEAEG